MEGQTTALAGDTHSRHIGGGGGVGAYPAVSSQNIVSVIVSE